MHWLIGQRMVVCDHFYEVVGRTPDRLQLLLLARRLRSGVWRIYPRGDHVASFPVYLIEDAVRKASAEG